ncbi:MAG: hypothetical protein AABX16_01225 [Nanoarchaeota archaeon]
MSFNTLVTQIESSSEFKAFKQKNPDAELCAGFFVIDLARKDNKSALDYKHGDSIFTFSAEDEKIKIEEDELITIAGRPPLQKIERSVTVDINEIKNIALSSLIHNKIISKLQKIIAVLQRHSLDGKDEKQVWHLTCMLEGMGIVTIIVDSESGEVIKFEKKNVMDFMNVKKA